MKKGAWDTSVGASGLSPFRPTFVPCPQVGLDHLFYRFELVDTKFARSFDCWIRDGSWTYIMLLMSVDMGFCLWECRRAEKESYGVF